MIRPDPGPGPGAYQVDKLTRYGKGGGLQYTMAPQTRIIGKLSNDRRNRFSETRASPYNCRQEGCPRTGCTRCAREALLQGGKCASVQHSGKKQFQFQEGWARSECIQSRDRYYKTCSTSL